MISMGLHVLDDLLPAARHHQAGHVGLHADHLDVHEVPGDGLEDLVLRPLDVEDEPVYCGITQSQEESVERQALEGQASFRLLLQDRRGQTESVSENLVRLTFTIPAIAGTLTFLRAEVMSNST